MNQETLSERWNELFDRATNIKIRYIKEQCPICKNKKLNHFLDCKHIEIDFKEINKRINREIGKETRKMLRDHLEMFSNA